MRNFYAIMMAALLVTSSASALAADQMGPHPVTELEGKSVRFTLFSKFKCADVEGKFSCRAEDTPAQLRFELDTSMLFIQRRGRQLSAALADVVTHESFCAIRFKQNWPAGDAFDNARDFRVTRVVDRAYDDPALDSRMSWRIVDIYGVDANEHVFAITCNLAYPRGSAASNSPAKVEQIAAAFFQFGKAE